MSVSDTLRAEVLAAMKRGVTRYKIAKGAGIDHGNLTRYIYERRDIRLSTVDALCEVLGLALQHKPKKGRKAGPSPGAKV